MDKKRIIPIFLIIFTNILGAGVIIPVLPLFARHQFGASNQQATLLASAYFGAQFLAAPWLGRLSDRFGRRPILLVSQAGTILSFIMFIFAAPLGAGIEAPGWALPVSGGLIMLFAARTLDGITGGNITTAQAYISDVTDPQDRAQAMGLISAAFGLGFVIGPAFGGLLAQWGVLMPFIGAAIITTGTFLLTLVVLDESLPAEARIASLREQKERIPLSTIFATRSLALIILVGFLAQLAFASLQSTFALFADQILFTDFTAQSRVPVYIGIILSIMGVFVVLTQLFLIRPLVRRFGEQRLIAAGQILLALAMFSLSLLSNPFAVTANFAPLAFARGISDPSLQSLVTRYGTPKTRGQILGRYQSALSLANIFGPIWAGAVFEYISPQATYKIGAGIVVLALVFAVLLIREEVPEAAAKTKAPVEAAAEG